MSNKMVEMCSKKEQMFKRLGIRQDMGFERHIGCLDNKTADENEQNVSCKYEGNSKFIQLFLDNKIIHSKNLYEEMKSENFPKCRVDKKKCHDEMNKLKKNLQNNGTKYQVKKIENIYFEAEKKDNSFVNIRLSVDKGDDADEGSVDETLVKSCYGFNVKEEDKYIKDMEESEKDHYEKEIPTEQCGILDESFPDVNNSEIVQKCEFSPNEIKNLNDMNDSEKTRSRHGFMGMTSAVGISDLNTCISNLPCSSLQYEPNYFEMEINIIPSDLISNAYWDSQYDYQVTYPEKKKNNHSGFITLDLNFCKEKDTARVKCESKIFMKDDGYKEESVCFWGSNEEELNDVKGSETKESATDDVYVMRIQQENPPTYKCAEVFIDPTPAGRRPNKGNKKNKDSTKIPRHWFGVRLMKTKQQDSRKRVMINQEPRGAKQKLFLKCPNNPVKRGIGITYWGHLRNKTTKPCVVMYKRIKKMAFYSGQFNDGWPDWLKSSTVRLNSVQFRVCCRSGGDGGSGGSGSGSGGSGSGSAGSSNGQPSSFGHQNNTNGGGNNSSDNNGSSGGEKRNNNNGRTPNQSSGAGVNLSPTLPAPVLDDKHRREREEKEKGHPGFKEPNTGSQSWGDPLSNRTVPTPNSLNIHQPHMSNATPNQATVSHASISMVEFCDVLGAATSTILMAEHRLNGVNTCLIQMMHDLSRSSSSQELQIDECTICNLLGCLFTHVANCSVGRTNHPCTTCSQINNLMMSHAALCIKNQRSHSSSSGYDLCYKMCKYSEWQLDKLSQLQDRLKGKIKKYCTKVLGASPKDLTDITECTPQEEVGETGIDSFYGETNGPSSSTSKPSTPSYTSSGNIVVQESQCTGLTDHEHQTEVMTSSSKFVTSATNLVGQQAVDTGPAPFVAAQSGPVEVHNTHVVLTRKNSKRRPPDIPQQIAEEDSLSMNEPSEKMILERWGKLGRDPYETQPTYGEKTNYQSMPVENVRDAEQFMSLNTRMSEPGIGAVVFAHPSRLRIVAKFWAKKREECERTGQYPDTLREEGVILADQKANFSILRTRYQKHVQWQRLIHLGNGMSGKCHLAIDLKTNFKFCCKKIHLLRYSEEELSLWTEMQNPYIVRLYGAIRHGDKIYIFSEFIDGGDLAACIEKQKFLGQRLSHWSAINYFQQLLYVLAYLQSKSILHEDIKADNILLCQNTTQIAVTDFGTSRKLNDPKELKNKQPVGSPTHWSPEKASMEGHGFPSDLWAAICVLIHMLSGVHPWIKRYQRAGMLNYIIYAQPPPLDDVPKNIQDIVRDLIAKGLVKDPQERPTASQLLNHPAFNILNDGNQETYYSNLMSHSFRPPIRSVEVQEQRASIPAVLATTSVESKPTEEENNTSDTVKNSSLAAASPENTEPNSQTSTQKVDETPDIVDAPEERSFTPMLARSQHTSQLDPRVTQLIEPLDIENLLPAFSELIDDTSENNRRVIDFFGDDYKMGAASKLGNTSPLREYKPELKEGGTLPILSIFDTMSRKSSSVETFQSTQEMVLKVKTETSATKISRIQASGPVSFLLSSESDECTSADLFLDENAEITQNPVVPDNSDASVDNVDIATVDSKQKKPKITHSISETTGTTKKDVPSLQLSHTWGHFPSAHQALTGPPHTTPVSSRPSYFHNHKSVIEEQDQAFQTLSVYPDPDTQNREDEATADDDVERPSAFDFLQREIDSSSLQGHKLTFLDTSEKILFDIRIRDQPIYWKHIIKLVRPQVTRFSVHFSVTHKNGSAVDLDQCITAEYLIVVPLGGPDNRCCCVHCHSMI